MRIRQEILGRRIWLGSGYAPGYNPFFQNGAADPEFEARALTAQIEMMEHSLKEAKERLEELKKQDE